MKTVKLVVTLAIVCSVSFSAQAAGDSSNSADEKKELLSQVIGFQIKEALQYYDWQNSLLTGNEVLIKFSISNENVVEIRGVSSSNAFLEQHVRKALNKTKLSAKPIEPNKSYQLKISFK